ncbi:hypothetical protein F7734_15125 [Scytonema sp. UIC 10036]|uniref:hypothetical protein n=1 Tax=Scytonema sp. UIC 10036 TaxID=2304196 RepID=UPI0012DA40A0|nr:hypothetical protein [Scytonema sp. UIC 10036]MUG93679.1 hypothetical protein [Scytonema sp. UIC 10036]
MSKLQIFDLNFCELVTEENTQITGGLVFSDLSQIGNFDYKLEGYTKTEVPSTAKSRLLKLEKPGSYGYQLETNESNSKSSILLLIEDTTNGIKSVTSAIKTVST